MSNVHFIGGEKGGVGKSMTSRLLAQYYIDRKRPFLGFDSDASHGTFSRFYGEFASPVIVGEDDSLDGILEAGESNPDHDLIIDLAAQTATRLGEWIEETDVFGLLDEMGYQVYLWHVMDDGADSIDLLARSLERNPQPELQYVVVQNLGRGSDFSQFRASPAWRAAQGRGQQPRADEHRRAPAHESMAEKQLQPARRPAHRRVIATPPVPPASGIGSVFTAPGRADTPHNRHGNRPRLPASAR